MAATPQENKPEDILAKVTSDKEVPNIYANGFMSGLGTGDVVTVFQRNGQPIAVLNLSYTVAKTLAISLIQLISDLEKKSGNSIMTTQEVDRNLNATR